MTIALSILATMGQRSTGEAGVATLGGASLLDLTGCDRFGEALAVKVVRENQGGAG